MLSQLRDPRTNILNNLPMWTWEWGEVIASFIKCSSLYIPVMSNELMN